MRISEDFFRKILIIVFNYDFFQKSNASNGVQNFDFFVAHRFFVKITTQKKKIVAVFSRRLHPDSCRKHLLVTTVSSLGPSCIEIFVGKYGFCSYVTPLDLTTNEKFIRIE